MCIVMSTVTAVQSMLFCQRSNIPRVVLNAISILSTYLPDIFSLIYCDFFMFPWNLILYVTCVSRSTSGPSLLSLICVAHTTMVRSRDTPTSEVFRTRRRPPFKIQTLERFRFRSYKLTICFPLRLSSEYLYVADLQQLKAEVLKSTKKKVLGSVASPNATSPTSLAPTLVIRSFSTAIALDLLTAILGPEI
jgi:hypothetical protein